MAGTAAARGAIGGVAAGQAKAPHFLTCHSPFLFQQIGSIRGTLAVSKRRPRENRCSPKGLRLLRSSRIRVCASAARLPRDWNSASRPIELAVRQKVNCEVTVAKLE